MKTSLLTLAVGCALLALTSPLTADEYDDLRSKWCNIIIGTGYDVADPDVASRLASIASSANSSWSSMNKAAGRTYLWSDLQATNNSAQLTSAYSRLRAMALAYATPGCSLAGNTSLLADTIGGLDWMHANRYGAATAQYGNWWDWEIGSPLNLTDINALLYSQLTGTQVSNYMAAVDHQTPTPDMTHANRVWKARVVGVRGCIVRSSSKIALARDAFDAVFPYVTSSDGFYRDGSFIQHNRHPYTAGYGTSLLGNMAPLMNWLSGSAWQVTNPAQANLYAWVFDSYEPILYRGAAWDLVRGREISRSSASPQGTGHGIMDAILQIAQFAPPTESSRMKSMVKFLAQSDTVRDFVGGRGLPTLMLAKNLLADTNVAPRGELIGHYQFPSMDRVIHLRPGFGFGLSLCSSRIYNFESINGENLHGWFTGDGMTVLYNADLDQFGDAYWATIDAYRLPGVTADPLHNRLPPNPGSIGSSAKGANALSAYNWVGGVKLGDFGAAGMQLDGWSVTLTAKKSWFMFDDEIVCLGAGITSTDARPIEHTIENRKLNSAGSNPFMVDGTRKPAMLNWNELMTGIKWAHLAGTVSSAEIGYFFPTPATVRGVREARNGAWSDVNEGGSTNLITRNYLRMTVEYGTNPANGTYSYVLLPAANTRQVSRYASAPDITVLANNGNVQAVREATLGITAANFWTDSTQSAGGITVNRKSSVLVKDDGTFIEVAVSDPTQAGGTTPVAVQVLLDGRVLVSADPAVTVVQASPWISLKVNVNGARGATFRARFFKGPAQSIVIPPEADAYVRDGADNADLNFGTAGVLTVKKGTATYNREAFIRFDIPSYSGVLLGAALKLMPTTSQIPGVHGAVVVPDNSWVESGTNGITWNTRPAASSTLLSTWTPAVGGQANADVTGGVTGSGPVTFKVYPTTQTSDGYVDYASRENGTVTNRPSLILSVGHTPPEIKLIAPLDGEYMTQVGPVTMAANAMPTDGEITNVGFYDGGMLLGSRSVPPYSMAPVLTGGVHDLFAIATDANGLSSTSMVTRVDVANPPAAAMGTASTAIGTPIDIDLLPLVSDVETPASQLRIAVGAASNGTVVLLSDGRTARFTPAPGFSGPTSFNYSVTDMGYDSRTVCNYRLQGDTLDSTPFARNGGVTVLGTGAFGYATDAPSALAARLPQSLVLTENGTNGAARLDRTLSVDECDLRNGNWTIAGWFKRNSSTDIDSLLQLGASGGWASDALSLVCPNGGTNLELRNYAGATQNIGITKTGIALGAWHHFAVVRNGATISLYVNGGLAGSDNAFTFTFSVSQPVKFGGVGSTSVLDRWLDGRLADLAVFRTALSGPEIASLVSQPVAYLGGQTATGAVSVAVVGPLVPPVVNFTASDAARSNLVMSLGTVYGRQYVLEAATNLVAPIAWTPVLTNAGTGSWITNNVPLSGSVPRRFYRYNVR